MENHETALLNIVKAELHSQINELKIDNLLTTVPAIRSQLAILDVINNACFLEPEIAGEPDQQNAENINNDSLCADNEDGFETIISEDGKLVKSKFTQLLRGGCLLPQTHPHNVFVPEKIVRLLDLEEGDYIQAILTEERESRSHSKFEYELLEKNPISQNPIRHEYKLITVKKHSDFDRFCIELKPQYSEVPFEIILSDNDVSRFSIENGDIIDYATLPDNPNVGKVIWKHGRQTEFTTSEKLKKKGLKLSKSELKSDTTEQTLENVRVVLVGGEAYNLSQKAKMEIEKRGGVAVGFSGDEPRETIVSALKKADTVILYLESTSHDAMFIVRETCKEYNVRLRFVQNRGGSVIASILEEQEKQKSRAISE